MGLAFFNARRRAAALKAAAEAQRRTESVSDAQHEMEKPVKKANRKPEKSENHDTDQ